MYSRTVQSMLQWRHRRTVVVGGGSLLFFALIFWLRVVDGSPTSGLTSLYVLPIALLAFEFGPRVGGLGGLLGLGLFAIWDAPAATDTEFAGYVVRGTVFLLVGIGFGELAARLRIAGAHVRAGTRHFSLTRDLLCVTNLDGYMTQLSGSWEDVLGWSRAELMASPSIDFVHPDDRERTEAEAALAAAGLFTAHFTNRYRTRDGAWRWLEWSSQFDPDRGEVYGAARDVTERQETERARREAEELFRRVFEDSPSGMALVGVAGQNRDVIVEANAGLAKLVGVPAAQLSGSATLDRFVHPEDAGELGDGIRKLAAGAIDVCRSQCRIVRADGQAIWVEVSASMIRDEAGEPVYRLAQLIDIDARKRAEDKLRFFADHDPLSGVYNRRRFEQELERELAHQARSGGRGAVLILDVDDFKQINDTLGHPVGDAVIAALGDVLNGRLRSGDVVARLGGDEFAVILRRVSLDQACAIAAQIQSLASARLSGIVGESLGPITLSIGLTTLGGPGVVDGDELLRIADRAMYEAKRGGGARLAARPVQAPKDLSR